MYFGEKLSIILKQKKMTQRALADELDVNVQAINRYIKSDRQPRINFIKKVAKTLNVPVSYFVNDFAEISVNDKIEIMDFIKMPVISNVAPDDELEDANSFMDEVYVHRRFAKAKDESYMIRANSSDMEPFIHKDDYILVCRTNDYKNDDTVLIRHKESGRVHVRGYAETEESVVFFPSKTTVPVIVSNQKKLRTGRDQYEVLGKVTYQVRVGE
ncbi:MAG: helix-turn-helix domain-containing protein [Candidatus Muiribacteriaceae bacterium]